MCSFLCSWDDSSSVSSGLSDTLDNLSTDDLNTTSSVSSYSNITASSRKNTHAQVSIFSLPFLAMPCKHACRITKKNIQYQCLWNKWNTNTVGTSLSHLCLESPWILLTQPWPVDWHLRCPACRAHIVAEGYGWQDPVLPAPGQPPLVPTSGRPQPLLHPIQKNT